MTPTLPVAPFRANAPHTSSLNPKFLFLAGAATIPLALTIIFGIYRFLRYQKDPEGAWLKFAKIDVNKNSEEYIAAYSKLQECLTQFGYEENTPINEQVLWGLIQLRYIRENAPWMETTHSIDRKTGKIQLDPNGEKIYDIPSYQDYVKNPTHSQITFFDHYTRRIGYIFIQAPPSPPKATLENFLLAIASKRSRERAELNARKIYRLLALLNNYSVDAFMYIDLNTFIPVSQRSEEKDYIFLSNFYTTYLGRSFYSKDGTLFYDLRTEFKEKHPNLDTRLIDEQLPFNKPCEA